MRGVSRNSSAGSSWQTLALLRGPHHGRFRAFIQIDDRIPLRIQVRILAAHVVADQRLVVHRGRLEIAVRHRVPGCYQVLCGVLARAKKGGFTSGPLVIECLNRGDAAQVTAEARKARLFLEKLTGA